MTPANERQVQLIVYPDGLGGHLRHLVEAFDGPLKGVFPGGVHLLPPFPSSADRGFAPVRYDQIEPSFGTWDEVERLARSVPLTVDVMVNHISRRSSHFEKFQAEGRDSPAGEYFITIDQVFPAGAPTEDDVAAIFLRKPDHPFLTVSTSDGDERIWASFGSEAEHAEQVDLNVTNQATWELYESWFRELQAHGVHQVRLDAVGYLTKEAGTACFMNEPEIWDILDRFEQLGDKTGLRVLPEIHAGSDMHRRLAAKGHLSYDFALPGLVLEALHTGRSHRLSDHLRSSPSNQVTMLDCHDGIPMHPDLDEVLDATAIISVVDSCVERGANINPVLRKADSVGPAKAHQINCTYRSAVGSDDALLVARAIQLFSPGTPQVYYVGLLAGENAPRIEGGDGREVNRKNYSWDEFGTAIERDVVRQQLELIQHRNDHPAFGGELDVPQTADNGLTLVWHNGAHWARLDVDLSDTTATMTSTGPSGTVETVILGTATG